MTTTCDIRWGVEVEREEEFERDDVTDGVESDETDEADDELVATEVCCVDDGTETWEMACEVVVAAVLAVCVVVPVETGGGDVRRYEAPNATITRMKTNAATRTRVAPTFFNEQDQPRVGLFSTAFGWTALGQASGSTRPSLDATSFAGPVSRLVSSFAEPSFGPMEGLAETVGQRGRRIPAENSLYLF